MNLLLLEPGERQLHKADARTRHIRKVLRLQPGDRLRAGELGGPAGVATIVTEDAHGITLAFDPTEAPVPLPPVELLLGHPRPIVLKRMLRDLTALGPGRIVVTPTELGEKSYYDSTIWHDVHTPMREGAAQGGTTLLPELVRGPSLRDSVDALRSPPDRRLVLHARSEDAAGPAQADLLARLAALPEPADAWTTVAVGSERGWSDAELDFLVASGFSPCALGSRILRTETAATIAVWAAVLTLARK